MGEAKQTPAERLAAVLSNVAQRAAEIGREALGELVAHIAALEAELSKARTASSAHLREVDAVGTRATQNGMAARIAELEAELARLKPSGRVAEDVDSTRAWLAQAPARIQDALSRLAAKAQGYEAAMEAMDEDGAESQDGESLVERIEALSEDRQEEKARAERAESERDTAVAERESWRQCAEERQQAAQQQMTDKHAAVADNAALLDELRHARLAMAEVDDSRAPADIVRAEDRINLLLKTPHPGHALLEQHRKEVEALKEAIDSQQAESHTLRRAFLHERHRAEAAGAAPEHAHSARWAENLLADERRALVRARNEGLETTAAWHDSKGDAERRWLDLNEGLPNRPTTEAHRAFLECHRSSAIAIRAMKEPE